MIEISTEDADRVCSVIRMILEAEGRAYEEGKKKLSELEALNNELKDTPFAAAAENVTKETAEKLCNEHLKNKAELEFVLSLMYTGSEKKE